MRTKTCAGSAKLLLIITFSGTFLLFLNGFTGHVEKRVQFPNVTILMWTEFCHSRRILDAIRKEAPVPPWCKITFDRTKLSKSEAVVFHTPGTDLDFEDLPLERSARQLWVFFSLESPAYMTMDMSQWDKMQFNRTMTYRLDSDIHIPYGSVKKINGGNLNLKKTRKKKKLAVWMASNCLTFSEREDIIEKLQKRIEIDVYGDCGEKQCDPDDLLGCYEKLAKDYKFFFAFENSICKDYVTEKFWLPLIKGLVPVVFGGADYSKIFPHSRAYINLSDFPDLDSLADYLLYLNQNQTAYEEYFHWRKQYQILAHDESFTGFGKLCHAIQNGETRKRKTYHNMKHWWHDGVCNKSAQKISIDYYAFS